MRKEFSINELLEYCEKYAIRTIPKASRTEIEASIARHFLDGQSPAAHKEIGCYGYWDEDDANCRFCALNATCKEVSLGSGSTHKFEKNVIRTTQFPVLEKNVRKKQFPNERKKRDF